MTCTTVLHHPFQWSDWCILGFFVGICNAAVFATFHLLKACGINFPVENCEAGQVTYLLKIAVILADQDLIEYPGCRIRLSDSSNRWGMYLYSPGLRLTKQGLWYKFYDFSLFFCHTFWTGTGTNVWYLVFVTKVKYLCSWVISVVYFKSNLILGHTKIDYSKVPNNSAAPLFIFKFRFFFHLLTQLFGLYAYSEPNSP